MRPSVEVATSVFALHTHLVPAPVFAAAQLDRMEAMGAVWADFGCELIEVNGRGQHVHLLVTLPPAVAPSRLVKSLRVTPPAGGTPASQRPPLLF